VSIFDQRDSHFEPALIRSMIVISVCVASVLLLVLWTWLTHVPSLTKTMLTGALLIAAASAFIAGNTFRLRDVRARIGNQVRSGRLDKANVLAELPPRETIRRRFTMAVIGTLLAVLVLGLTLFYARNDPNGIQTTGAVSILGVVASALCFVGGTVVRPID
jgi:CHASE2 domain-containing sensor protein